MGKSVIANTIVRSNVTLLPISFAACAATQGIWLGIAQTDNVEPIGVMGLKVPCLVARLLAASVVVMLSTVKWRYAVPYSTTNTDCNQCLSSNSCKSFPVVPPTVLHLNASKLALADMKMDKAKAMEEKAIAI